MTTPSRWWFAAFVIVVFLAGTSVGVMVDRAWLLRAGVAGPRSALVGLAPNGRAGLGRGAADVPGRVVDVNVRRLRDLLSLTPEQEAAARPLVEEFLDRVRTLQQGTRDDLLEETVRLETAISSLSPALTAAQREQLASFRRELIVPAPARGRGRLGGTDVGRGGRGGIGREGPARPGGPGRE